ncbi:MAG: hypothetical protein ACLTXL_16140 [Clostridia bacterium]
MEFMEVSEMLYFLKLPFSFCPQSLQVSKLFIVLLDKQSFSYYDTHNQTRKTVEKRYIFDRVFTESCRRWDCSIALEMEWTFEGSPEFWYGLTLPQSLREPAYMLDTKSGPKVKLSGTADMKFVSSIRFKSISDTWDFTKIVLCTVQHPDPQNLRSTPPQLLANAVTATGPAAAAKHLYQSRRGEQNYEKINQSNHRSNLHRSTPCRLLF